MKPALTAIAAFALFGCQEASSDSPGQAAAVGEPAAVTAITPVAPGAKVVPGRTSRFTKVTDAACPLVEEDKETGDFSRRCPGIAGWTVLWTSGDLRDDLTVARGKISKSFGYPSLVAKGPFDAIGETVEWRGPAGGEPDVLVARVHVARPDGSSDSGRLAVARLGDKPCVVAIVPPGAGQSDRARAIADGSLPHCLED